MDTQKLLPGDARAYAVLGRMIGAGLWMIAGGILGGLLTLHYLDRQPTVPPQVVTLATPAKILTKVQRETVPCTIVQAYQPIAKAKLKLPAAVVASPSSHVLASSDVRAGERDTRVSTVLDTQTGAVDTYTEAMPLPWLRMESNAEVGAYYGVKSSATRPVGRLTAQYDAFQVKGLHLGVMGTLDTDGQAFAGIGGRVRW